MTPYLILTLFAPIVLLTSNPIENPSFESDDYPLPTNTLRFGSHIISNWMNYDPSSTLLNSSIGIVNPTGGTSINDALYGTGVPQGTQCAYVLCPADAELGIYQILTSIIITAQTNYTLYVNIANAIYPNSNYIGYRVQLLVAHKNIILAEDDNKISISQSQWKQSAVSVRVLSGNEFIGESLAVRLINKGTAMVYFDNVRLEVNTMTASNTDTETDEKKEQNMSMLDWLFLLLGVLVIVSCCVLVLLVAVFIRKRMNQLDEDEDVIEINLKQPVINMPMISVDYNYNTVFASGVIAQNGYVGSEDNEDKKDKKTDKRVVEDEDQKIMDVIKVTVKDEYDTPQKPLNPDDDPALVAGLEETIE